MYQHRHSLPIPLQQSNVQDIRNIALQRLEIDHPLYSTNTLITPHVFQSSSSSILTKVVSIPKITNNVQRGLPILLILDRSVTRAFENSAFIFDFFTKQLQVC